LFLRKRSGSGAGAGYVGATHFLPVILLRQHLPQIGDIGGGFIFRQVGGRDFFRFLKPATQADDEREVLTDFRPGVRLRHRTPQRDLGVFQILGQQVRQAKVRKNRGLIRHDLERRGVMTLRVGVASHLVEDRALHIEDAPIGCVRRMCVIERDQRLLVLARIGERAAIGAEQWHIVGIPDGCLLEYGNRLGALVARAQCARIGNGGIRVAGIIAVVGCQGIQGLPRVTLGACSRTRLANRARGVVACDIGAPAGR